MLINPIWLTWATVLAAVIPAISLNSSGEGQGRSSSRLFWSKLKVPWEVEDLSITQRASVYKTGQSESLAIGVAALVCEMIMQSPDPSPRLLIRRSWLLQDAVEWSDRRFSQLFNSAAMLPSVFHKLLFPVFVGFPETFASILQLMMICVAIHIS